MVPPTFLTSRISRKSTFDDVGVTSRVTAVTAIGAKVDEYWETIFTPVSHDSRQVGYENDDAMATLDLPWSSNSCWRLSGVRPYHSDPQVWTSPPGTQRPWYLLSGKIGQL